MTYQYFVSYWQVVGEEKGFGNMVINSPHVIDLPEHLVGMQAHIRNETLADGVVIVNYQLLRTLYVERNGSVQ